APPRDPRSTTPQYNATVQRHSTTPMPHAVSQLEQTLRAHRFAITTELTPPVSFDPDDLLGKARPLKGLVDAVNVTDGASATARSGASPAPLCARSPRVLCCAATGSTRSCSSPAAIATASRCKPT